MAGIRFHTLTWTVADILRRWSQLALDPPYQREGNIWSLSRRQLFIDSILNGFDSPKIYLHELVPPEFVAESLLRYAVVDGRQRLEALRVFAEGGFQLSEEFTLIGEEQGSRSFDVDAQESEFARSSLFDLQEASGVLARRFFGYELTVVIVRTDDVSYIEELFFRLNEGAPLTPAEKRNRGELLRAAVDDVRGLESWRPISVADRRGRHSDLVVRFMFLEDRDATLEKVPDMKASLLDEFTKQFRPAVGQTFGPAEEANARSMLSALTRQVERTLSAVARVFQPEDPMLRRIGDVLTFYVLFRSDSELANDVGLRDRIGEFFERAGALEGEDEEQMNQDELMILDYFGATQGTTTGSYLAARASLIHRYVRNQLELRPDDRRLS